MNNSRLEARTYYEEKTKNMSLEEKYEWIKTKLFYIEVDNYIEDKEEWREYLQIKDEIVEEIKNGK